MLADVGFVKNAGRSVPKQPVNVIPPSSGMKACADSCFYMVSASDTEETGQCFCQEN